MDQIVAVNKRDNLYPRRQNVVIELLDFGMKARKRRLRVGAFAHRHPGRDHIGIVDQLAVFAPNGARKLTQPNLGPLLNDSNVFEVDRRAVLRQNDGVLDIIHVLDEPDLTNIELLQSDSTEAAAGISVAVGEL